MQAALLAQGFALTGGCLSYPPPRQAKVSDDTSTLYAPHFDGEEYHNPWAPFVPSFKRRLQFMLTANPYPRRKPDVPMVVNDGVWLLSKNVPDSLTWIGHSTVAIQERGAGCADRSTSARPHFYGGPAFSTKRSRGRPFRQTR